MQCLTFREDLQETPHRVSGDITTTNTRCFLIKCYSSHIISNTLFIIILMIIIYYGYILLYFSLINIIYF